jgi:hypothetical protein
MPLCTPEERAPGYSGIMSDAIRERLRVGLCLDCRSMRQMNSDRGSTFYLCARSATDAAFPKYPRLPMLQCRGYQPIAGETDPGKKTAP